MTWLRHLEVSDVRNIHRAELELGAGLNVLMGANAQGKTSILEALGLLARARSFRSDDLGTVQRSGAARLGVSGTAVEGDLETRLELQVEGRQRRLRVGGVDVPVREYLGRLEAQVYSTERLRVVRGSMRERRQYFDRGAAALWPAYRQLLRDYTRVLAQRAAALESRQPGLEAWNERFVDLGGCLRARRARYLELLTQASTAGYRPSGERYEVDVAPHGIETDEPTARAALAEEVRARARDEQGARRCLVGPHRDQIRLRLDGQDAAEVASSGQARSLMLALTLAALSVYRREHGTSAVALLDDLDSELDERRATELCRQVAARGQALVTTAHPGWVRRLSPDAVYEVVEGRVRRAA